LITTQVCEFSVSSSTFTIDSEDTHYTLVVQDDIDSVYFLAEVVMGIDTTSATKPDGFPSSGTALLDSYLQQTMYRFDKSDMILHKSLTGLPVMNEGREYIIEGKADDEDYLIKGYIINSESYFISLSVIYHASEKIYAENYIDLIYNSLDFL